MTVNIPLVKEKKFQRLSKQVKNIDLYELMLLEIQDHADWLISEYTRICREESGGNPALFRQCLYESRREVEKSLWLHINNVIQSAITLFGIFYDYDLPKTPKESEFYRKVEEIVKDTLRIYTPQ